MGAGGGPGEPSGAALPPRTHPGAGRSPQADYGRPARHARVCTPTFAPATRPRKNEGAPRIHDSGVTEVLVPSLPSPDSPSMAPRLFPCRPLAARRAPRTLAIRSLVTAVVLGLATEGIAGPRAAAAQLPTPGREQRSLTSDDVRTIAAIHAALLQLRDSSNVDMARARNKTREAQARLQDQFREKVAALLRSHGLDEAEFERRRYLVSTNDSLRLEFDALVARAAGAPRPVAASEAGASPSPAAATTTSRRDAGPEGAAQPTRTVPVGAPDSRATAPPVLPPGAVGVHVGHVAVRFMDTPDRAGLLDVAMAEARIAAEHAGFAARAPTDLDAMRRHAAHVLHALDPARAASGPGRGYGLQKAVRGVATHIELAARADGASPAVKTHAERIATAARSVLARSDEAVALAEQVQGATSAAVAAPLVTQLLSLCLQLTSGADLDADGRVGWDGGEGGLQQAEEQLRLLLAAVGPG